MNSRWWQFRKRRFMAWIKFMHILAIKVDLVITFLRHHELIAFYDSVMAKLQVLIAFIGGQYKRIKYSEPLTMKLAWCMQDFSYLCYFSYSASRKTILFPQNLYKRVCSPVLPKLCEICFRFLKLLSSCAVRFCKVPAKIKAYLLTNLNVHLKLFC